MAKQQRILTGQVAAITGAARGIGRATAQAFLREGMKVAIGDLDFATAQQTAKELGLMKKTAYLVNTSRGPIVEEKALIDALSKKQIAGAGLDVFDVEPLPLDHPYRKMDNVVITPHLGYVSQQNYEKYYPDIVENIRGFLDGKPPRVIAPR